MVTRGDLFATTGQDQIDTIIASIVSAYGAVLPGMALGFERYFPALYRPEISLLPAV